MKPPSKELVTCLKLTQSNQGDSKWCVQHPAGKFEFYGTYEQLKEIIQQMGLKISNNQMENKC